jgi:DNA primase
MSNYSSALLQSLRNQIPIEKVITHMNMEIKPGGKWLRFRCPRCHNFHTATSNKTNLARCFDCKKNFNPIDMVMVVGNVSFTEAVEFLMQYLQEA